ncbi:MAG: hypothetical protein HXY43_14035 [Fischerella sp.]|uniref:hypothetical protein n=1 Tax=Fischerella sp. TaxID=1191 RepID=UPI00180B293E|nr:hypothetical protein [Fischerella sp.]NWF60341.1 hypothetical protein [Fischerella sp.]
MSATSVVVMSPKKSAYHHFSNRLVFICVLSIGDEREMLLVERSHPIAPNRP